MLVYGRNVAKEILKKDKKVIKIILQEGFDDKEINIVCYPDFYYDFINTKE